MITNLNDLLAKASSPAQSQMVKRTGEWTYEDASGNIVTETFEVWVMKDIPFAAQERIYLGDEEFPDAGSMCRGISERLRFGENGQQKMSYQQAAEMPASLATALFMVITGYNTEQRKKLEAQKSGADQAKE